MIRALLFMFLIGFAYGSLRQWTVSQATYAAQVGTLVTAKYKALLAVTETFKPKADACAVNVNATSDKCQACLATVECGDSNAALAWVQKLKSLSPTVWGPKLESELSDIANKFASGAEKIYNKYGAPAINALSDGLNAIGSTFESIGNAIGSGLKAAFNAVQNAFEALFDKFKDIFGKRRRRSVMVAEATVVREKRAEVSAEAQECMSKCPDCSAFVSGDQETAMRAICGDTLVDEKNSLETQLAQLKAFYTDWEGATKDLLESVYIDTSTGKVATVSALKGGVYVTFNCASAAIPFDPWNQDPTYAAIAAYIYSQY